MDKLQARKILALYRPGSDDDDDPQFAEALALAERDPELRHWLKQHCAQYTAIRTKLKQVAVPQDLKERILAAHSPRRFISWWRQPAFSLAAAALVLFIALVALWLRPREDNGFSAYRTRMVRTALREYRMDLVTTNLTEIRQFLTTKQAPADYALPAPLQKLAGDGCAILSWHGRRVSMVCFDLGKHEDLYLFVMQHSGLPGTPASSPEFAKVSKLMTASWSAGDKIYILAGNGDEKFLRDFL